MSANEIVTIGDVAEVFDGPHATPKKIESGPYFLSISSLSKGALYLSQSAHLSEEDFKIWTKRVTPEHGDILFSYETRLGEAAMMPESIRACLGRRMGLLRPDRTKVIPEYLLYAYLSPNFQSVIEQRKIHGATVDRIALKELPTFPVRIPGLDEQRLVVNNLKAIDSKMQLNYQINQTLEQMAQAIFKSWFVDFEPVKAKIAALEAGGSEDDALLAAMQAIAGSALFATDAADADAQTQLARLQTEHPERYATLRATAELFPSAMQESELGEIPEGWTTKEIKALSTKISKGSTPRKSDLQNAEDPELIEFLKVRDLSDEGEIARTGLDKIPKSVHSGVLKRSILEADDILFSIAGTIGRVAVIEEELSDSNCNQALAFIRLAEPLKYLELCRLNLVGSRVQNEVVSKVVQGVQANFSLASLGEILIVIPLDGVLYEFNNTVTKFSKKRKELMTEVRVLAELRDTLLPKLLSGELSISAATDQITQAEEAIDVQS